MRFELEPVISSVFVPTVTATLYQCRSLVIDPFIPFSTTPKKYVPAWSNESRLLNVIFPAASLWPVDTNVGSCVFASPV